jgi:Protein of unknown function (DUF4242)
MPLCLDVHNKIEGLTAAGAAGVHRKDLEVQHKHGVKHLKYWSDEGTGKVFCLVKAPSKQRPFASAYVSPFGPQRPVLSVQSVYHSAIRMLVRDSSPC